MLGPDLLPAGRAAVRRARRHRTKGGCPFVALTLGLLAGAVAGCERRDATGEASGAIVSAGPPPAAPARAEPPPPLPPVDIETVEVPGDVPAFVLRHPRGDARMVFLHGMCGHGLGYVQAFATAASERGVVIGLQGDVSCGGPWRQWSGDVEGLHRRVEAAFVAAGLGAGADEEILLMGYSQGASRAEALAARHPERYTRVVLMGAPTTPSAARLKGLRGAVMMAGERDRQDHMKAAARALQAAGVPATYIALPNATHGSLGGAPGDGERVMRRAFEWLWANAPPAPRAR
jgi:predicted esterase